MKYKYTPKKQFILAKKKVKATFWFANERTKRANIWRKLSEKYRDHWHSIKKDKELIFKEVVSNTI